jgi:hypothetical protein
MNDRSALTDGWHPAYLLAITDEPTPETWQMYQQSPRLWRWHFAVWEIPTLIGRQAPEHQSAPSSQKFTPKGRQQASKAYAWTAALLGRQIPPGERVNLDPLMPLACRVKVSRKDDYANIVDLEAYPDGAALLTPEIRAMLAQMSRLDEPDTPPPAQTPAPTPPTPSPAPQPGMQAWGSAPAQPPASPWGRR